MQKCCLFAKVSNINWILALKQNLLTKSSAALCSTIHATNAQLCIWLFDFNACINWTLYICEKTNLYIEYTAHICIWNASADFYKEYFWGYFIALRQYWCPNDPVVVIILTDTVFLTFALVFNANPPCRSNLYFYKKSQ